MLAAERHPNRLQRPLEGGLRCPGEHCRQSVKKIGARCLLASVEPAEGAGTCVRRLMEG